MRRTSCNRVWRRRNEAGLCRRHRSPDQAVRL